MELLKKFKNGSAEYNFSARYIQIDDYTRLSFYHSRIDKMEKSSARFHPEEHLSYFKKKLTRHARRLLDKGDTEREKSFISIQKPSNLNRLKRNLAEICLLNRPQYFGTLTFSDDTIQRYGGALDDLAKDLIQKLHDFQKYHKGFRILYAFELGELNGRLHLHFIGDIPKELIKNNENGYPEIPYFRKRFGFMQMAKIGSSKEDYHKVSNYVTKYISKDALKVGNRYIHCVGNFEKPKAENLRPEIACSILNELFELKRKARDGKEVPIIQNHRFCISGWGFFQITELLNKKVPWWKITQKHPGFHLQRLEEWETEENPFEEYGQISLFPSAQESAWRDYGGRT